MRKNAEMNSGRLYSIPLPSGPSLGLQDPHFFKRIYPFWHFVPREVCLGQIVVSLSFSQVSDF